MEGDSEGDRGREIETAGKRRERQRGEGRER